jgi:hypothetical protein
MLIEEGLYAYLSTYSGLVSLISTRIYPVHIPQDAVSPHMSYQKIYSERNHALKNDSSVVEASFQFDVYAKSYNSVKAICEQLRKALQDFSGSMSSVTVQAVLMINEIDDYEETTKEYKTMTEYKIFYVES